MALGSSIKKCKKYVEMNCPRLLPYLLMIQRRSTKMIRDWPLEKAIAGDMESYRRHMGQSFDINHPVLFTEKLQRYKFFYHHPDFEFVTDKALFKEYVRSKIGDGHTIPMYGYWESVQEISKAWDNLPEEFVLKANLQSDGRNIMMIHQKTSLRFKKIEKTLSAWLDPRNTLANSWEYNFYCGSPKILAEKYMSNYKDQLYDYKLFCFDGEPYCVYVAMDHFGKMGSHISFYDLEWNKLPVQYGTHIVGDAPRPRHLAQMIDFSRILSKGFPFVRVDFFDTEEQLFVAELTFTPGGGVTPYNPESFNRILGDKFILPV